MKILLFTVPADDESFDMSTYANAEPLALEYLGAAVKENHDVRLVDLRIDRELDFRQVLEAFQPDITACGTYTTEVYGARKLCAEAKKLLPNVLTVIGGHHATVMPSDFIDENVDLIVMGEGVHTFKKICDYHEQGKSFHDIENIYYKKNGKMVHTFKKEHPPLDSLPLPDRTLTSHIRHHYKTLMTFKPTQIALIRSSVGCICRCEFCPISGILNHKLLKRSIDRVIEEFVTLKEPFVLWIDDEFLTDPERALLLAREIEKTGIKKKHFFLCRADTVCKHPECIEAWVNVGLQAAFIGIESHRDTDLIRMGKGSSTLKSQEAVRILRENNVTVRGGFMIQQDFIKDDFKKIADYIRELKVDMAALFIYTPLPGTKLWEKTKDQFLLHNYNLFDMMHTILPTTLPLKEFYKEYCNLLFKATLSPESEKNFLKAMSLKELLQLFFKRKKLYKKVKNSYRLYNLV